MLVVTPYWFVTEVLPNWSRDTVFLPVLSSADIALPEYTSAAVAAGADGIEGRETGADTRETGAGGATGGATTDGGMSVVG